MQNGDARFDGDVWDCFGPCNGKQRKYQPDWEKLDEDLRRNPGTEYSDQVNRIVEV